MNHGGQSLLARLFVDTTSITVRWTSLYAPSFRAHNTDNDTPLSERHSPTRYCPVMAQPIAVAFYCVFEVAAMSCMRSHVARWPQSVELKIIHMRKTMMP
jgi:hypothetical protein